MFCKKCISYEEGYVSKAGCVAFDKCKKNIADLSKVQIKNCIMKREIKK